MTIKPPQQGIYTQHRPYNPAGVFAWRFTRQTKDISPCEQSQNQPHATQTQTQTTTILQEVYYTSGAGLYDLRLAAWRAFESFTQASVNSTNYASDYIKQSAAAGMNAVSACMDSLSRMLWEASVRYAVQPSILSDLAIKMNDVAAFLHLYEALERLDSWVHAARHDLKRLRTHVDVFIRDFVKRLDALPFAPAIRNVWKRHVEPVYVRVRDVLGRAFDRIGGFKTVRRVAIALVLDAVFFV